jgi:hypothetical protein
MVLSSNEGGEKLLNIPEIEGFWLRRLWCTNQVLVSRPPFAKLSLQLVYL